jgi:C4-dicarboxylate transporter, DctQ subunit
MKAQEHTDAATAPGGPLAKTLRYLSKNLFYVSCICQFALVFTVSYEVVSRGIFGIPTMWSFDISSYLMLFIIFLGVAYVFQINRYVKIDFLYDFVSPKGRRFIDIIDPVLSLIWIGILTWQTWKFAFRSLREGIGSGTELELPVGYIQIFMFIGAVFLLLQIILFIWTNMSALMKSDGKAKKSRKEIS